MRLRRLQIRVQTTDGPYGTALDFPDGLVVIWAENSMGKSTCAKAILVALGMEAMLTHSRTVLPLPPAMTSELEAGSHRHTVVESEVFLEIENRAGDRVTIQRTIKGERNVNLITVFYGSALTSSSPVPRSRDFFVNLQGGASREAGFHNFLAQFLGWRLPAVQTYDGQEYPLYLQCSFPYFVVEQTRGWSTIQPPVPTHFRIRGVHKRAVEFLLNLDADKIALRRQELGFEKTRLENEWNARVRRANEIADSIGGIAQGIPQRLVAIWPPQVEPYVTLPAGNEWTSLERRIVQNEEAFALLVQEEIPRVQEITASASAELVEAEGAVKDDESVLSRLLVALDQEAHEAANIEQRIEALDEDIQRNKDAKTLRQLGSSQGLSVEAGTCPVCHQPIQDSLVPLAAEQVVMSLDENIEFLEEQKKTFGAVLSNARRIVQTRERQIRAIRDELFSRRERVRALKQTLISDGRVPSIAAIQNRIQLETRIKTDRESLSRFKAIVVGFSELAAKWNAVHQEISALPPDDLTDADTEKIEGWTKLLRTQLRQYAFKSLPIEQITISSDTYRPEHEGFELQTSISASDLIRTIWSYLHGMLELSRNVATNHPGLILFDEPRQQSTREVSFGQLLKRASSASRWRQQVIFFTSENRDTLQAQLAGLDHTFTPVPGRFIVKRK
jgi:hypothetical protein